MNTGMRFRYEKSKRRLELKSEFTPYRKTAGSSEMGIADPVKSACSKFVAPYHFIPGLEEKMIMKETFIRAQDHRWGAITLLT